MSATAEVRRGLPPLHPVVHLGILAACALIVALSMVLTPSTEALSFMGVELPPLCMWKRLTGMDCLGCGLTRSFTYMGHGQLTRAFELHVLGPVLFGLVASQIPWRLGRLGAWVLARRG